MDNSSRHKFQGLIALSHYIRQKGWIQLLVSVGLCLFFLLFLKTGIVVASTFALVPFILLSIYLFIYYIENCFYIILLSQFFLLIASSYADLPLGILSLLFTLVNVVLLAFHHLYKSYNWKNSFNAMFYIFLLWSVYCILEITNPNHIQEAWNISIMHYAFYPLLCALLLPLAVNNMQKVHWLFIIWGIFILLAAFKGFYQKEFGFNSREMYALYVLGKARTHIIWSGTRYFSFFTDAANYGVHMAMGAITFVIASFYVKNIKLKCFYVLISLAAIYGMGISGTRAAIAIPLGGLGLLMILSGKVKSFIITLLAILSLFFFFKFTYIGNGNEYIRKMRSAFNPTEDASYLVRVSNRENMKELMASKPFGYGIGLGGKAERFNPRELMPYPPDSWLVNVWTDTGIIGLILYLATHGVLFAWCSWILLFRIRNSQLKGLLTAWLCCNAGFFLSAYVNDVMQYPNSIIVYTGFALCFAGVHIDKSLANAEAEKESQEEKSDAV